MQIEAEERRKNKKMKNNDSQVSVRDYYNMSRGGDPLWRSPASQSVPPSCSKWGYRARVFTRGA